MLSRAAWRRRKALDTIEKHVAGADRFVDMGVLLCVVRRDLERGTELVPGKPPLVVVRRYRFGGMVDRRLRPVDFCGPSVNPVVWYCSEAQEELLVDADPEGPSRHLVYGAMGAGKTGCLVRWVGLLALRHTGIRGARIGITAPTEGRMLEVRKELGYSDSNGTWGCFPKSWWHWSERRMTYSLANAVAIDCKSTFISSKSKGSRIQGQTWVGIADDEIQDSLEDNANIEMRGRGAINGKMPRFSTCTAKDAPDWRTFRDRCMASPLWRVHKLRADSTPFVPLNFFEEKKHELTLRDYQRMVLVQDVGPERQTYPWSRERNLRPRPQIGARDVTSIVIRAKTGDPRHQLLGGCDPGNLKNVTLLLRAYQIKDDPRILWWVVGELTTGAGQRLTEDQGPTVEHHGKRLLQVVGKRWGCNVRDDGPQLHLRADPYGKNKKQPDKDVYRVLGRLGIDVRSAEYSKTGTGNGQIAVDARIRMVSLLLCNAAEESRLFVDVDDRGEPVAPELVRALEMSERDEAGNAETERKDETDLSHWPSALAYALWPWEKEAANAVRQHVAKELG